MKNIKNTASFGGCIITINKDKIIYVDDVGIKMDFEINTPITEILEWIWEFAPNNDVASQQVSFFGNYIQSNTLYRSVTGA